MSIVASLGLVLATTAAPIATQVPGDLTVYVFNVGQGDAILIVCPFGTHRMLIDAGDGGNKKSQEAFRALLTALVPEGETIDVVVSSHPHQDHVGGLHWVLSAYRVRKFIDNGKPYTTKYAKVRTRADSLVQAHKLKYFAADRFPPPSVADFCTDPGVKAELLIPNGFGEASEVNDNSVAVLVRHKNVKLLFTGDAEEVEERLLLQDPVVRQKLSGAAFYKLGHHGAETSSTEDLVAHLDLRVAAVSAGCKGVHPNTGYRHPRAVILQRLQQAMAARPDRSPTITTDAGLPATGKWTTVDLTEAVYTTGVDGTVRFGSNGTTVRRIAGSFASPLGTCN